MLKKTLVLALLAASSATFAGNWQVKVGVSDIAPSGESNLANGAVKNAQASNEVAFTPSVEYFFGNTPFSAELLLANPVSHDVKSDNLGKIASLKELPPTLTVKYNFKNSTRFTPYVGIGATAFLPWDVKSKLPSAKIGADNAFGVAGQVGVNYKPKDAQNWGLYFDVRYADINTDIKVNGAKVGSLDVNPVVYTVGYSYRF
ncbi:OmpW/AlkL family protein [Acinetobacter sp. ANC 3791]|uniref:OmpW/AlkL family protein n=1 Tax=Acinetobacter sp. ANC 3791 TaxID=2529836 RepID=UPI00103A9DB7|nr:OmpW family outer membrane protein [Acinetobacter sp. ANC 3791]TCB84567.1 OmpW family protein [Acinetobacter sp. ANC 3791]